MSSINKNIMAFKSSSSSSTTEYSKLSSTEKKKLFEEFTKKYNKVYDASEEESRYSTFESNLKVIDERNKAEQKKGGNAVHGVTIFADIDEDELLSSKMGFLEATKKNIIKMAKNGDEKTFDSVEDSEDIVDWSGIIGDSSTQEEAKQAIYDKVKEVAGEDAANELRARIDAVYNQMVAKKKVDEINKILAAKNRPAIKRPIPASAIYNINRLINLNGGVIGANIQSTIGNLIVTTNITPEQNERITQ
jgi:hypothetical protein